jgi:parallel beta helix pectate lyase-like protein
MPNHRSTASFISCVTAALAFVAAAQAQSNRTFVATGSDSNNCGATTPCRTFGAALALTNSGGEIVVPTSGGYGAATISQPVTITALGIDASITATSGNGLTINTSGNVSLTGLSLHGQGTGLEGILVQNVGSLFLYNITAENFTENGLEVMAGSVTVEDSTFRLNGYNGIAIDSGQQAYVHNVKLTRNSTGFLLGGGTAVVVDSSAVGNPGNGFQVGYPSTPASGGQLTLIRDQSVYNGIGLITNTPISGVGLVDCLITGNSTHSFQIVAGAIGGTSPGSNAIIGGGVGSLSTPPTLQ